MKVCTLLKGSGAKLEHVWIMMYLNIHVQIITQRLYERITTQNGR